MSVLLPSPVVADRRVHFAGYQVERNTRKRHDSRKAVSDIDESQQRGEVVMHGVSSVGPHWPI